MNTRIRCCNLLSTFITAVLLALPLAGYSQTSVFASPFGSMSGTSGSSGTSGTPVDPPVQAAPLPTPTPTPSSVFKAGMHVHDMNASSPTYSYGLFRDWDANGLHDAMIWNQDGSINFPLVDSIYALHRAHGAKVLKTFGSVPTWASKRPTEANRHYPKWEGGLSGPANLDDYEDYVYRFVAHEKDSLWAVEGWNEPYGCDDEKGEYSFEFTTMTLTELANVQKRVYNATQRVNKEFGTHILVFSPPQAYLCGIPLILNARTSKTETSESEPMWKYFNVLSWHGYNAAVEGKVDSHDYAAQVAQVRSYLVTSGAPANMPLADTEHGWGPWHPSGDKFAALSGEEKGKLLYDTAKLAKELGVITISWYSHDDELIGDPKDNPAICAWLQKLYGELNTQ